MQLNAMYQTKARSHRAPLRPQYKALTSATFEARRGNFKANTESLTGTYLLLLENRG